VRAGAKLVWNVNLIRQVWLEDVFGVGFDLVKKSSSAELNRSWMAGRSSLQYPRHLARRSSESRRAWSEVEHIPDLAGDAYWTRETVVA